MFVSLSNHQISDLQYILIFKMQSLDIRLLHSNFNRYLYL